MTLPPTAILGVDEKTGRTVMSIGSVGDCGCDKWCRTTAVASSRLGFFEGRSAKRPRPEARGPSRAVD